VAANPDAVAAEAAKRIAAALIAAIERRGRADFCTTGGNTPIPIYRLLSQARWSTPSRGKTSTSGGATIASCHAAIQSRT